MKLPREVEETTSRLRLLLNLHAATVKYSFCIVNNLLIIDIIHYHRMILLD